MPIDTIVLFMPPVGQYGWLQNFTHQMKEACERQGVGCLLIGSEVKDAQELFNIIFNASPDCTLSFNGLLPDQNGQFLCDQIQIPHVACLIDSPTHFFPLAGSPYTIITCIDRSFCDFFRHLKPNQVLFMPHAADHNLHCAPESERIYDVTMLSTCVDPEKIKDSWKQKYSPALVKTLEIAVELTLSEPNLFFMEAFTQAIDQQLKKNGGLDPETIHYEEVFADLEAYICSVDRVELLKAIPKEITVHVFGAGRDGTEWGRLFPPGKTNVMVHQGVPRDEALEIMKKSKVVLNSIPSFPHGAHERLFNAMACGAVVLTNNNAYLREQFEEGEEILFFRPKRWKDSMPMLLEVLNDEERRRKMANRAYAKVQQNHTWDARAKMLLEQLPPILERTVEEG